MKKAEKTLDVVKLDMMNVNIHKPSTDLGFSLQHDMMVLKKSGKVNDTQIFNFKRDVKAFLSVLCSHIVKKTTVQSHFARWARALTPIHMVESPDSCRNLFNHILQKLVNTQHITSEFADESKVQYAAFLQNIVKADKTYFQNYSIDDNKLDEFFIGYVEDHARYNKFVEIMKVVLTISHGKASVERGFSVSKNLLVENLQESSLIAQHRVVDCMVANCYEPYNFPMKKDLIQSVRNSYKKYSQSVAEKRKENVQKEKQKKAQPLSSEISSLEKKKILLQTTINDLRKESDNLGFEAEKASKLDLLKLLVTRFNALKRAPNDTQLELEE